MQQLIVRACRNYQLERPWFLDARERNLTTDGSANGAFDTEYINTVAEPNGPRLHRNPYSFRSGSEADLL